MRHAGHAARDSTTDLMPVYRISLHQPNGAVDSEHSVECENDQAAIDLASDVNHVDAINVWEEERLVARFTQRTRTLDWALQVHAH